VAGGAIATGGSYWFDRSLRAADRMPLTNLLKIPPLFEGRVEGAGKLFDLAVQSGETECFEGTTTPTIGVNSSYLGPTIKCRAGDRVTINVDNKMDFDTTLHWHGLHASAKLNGGPHQVIKPGATWSPSFVPVRSGCVTRG